MRAHIRGASVCALAALALAACGGDDGGGVTPDAGSDVTTERCVYEALAPTAGAGGTVAAGALTAGAGEVVLDVPVGTALGGYTGRAASMSDAIDARDRAISDGFQATVGIETAPRAKALALTAGGETIVIVKLDAIFVYEGMLFDLEDRLGLPGKVLLASSHSHAAWMQFTGHDALKVGGGELRQRVYDRMLDGAEAAARAALDARRPAKLGIHTDAAFDPDERINRDRRPENDALPGGDVGEQHLALLRVDGTDDTPIAVVPIFGEHGTLLDEDDPLASTEATGAIERVLEETIGDGVTVIHLQSAGADTSPVGHGDLDCANPPGRRTDPCLPFAKLEGHARVAAPILLAAYAAAADQLDADVALEMLTRSVELGPSPDTFTIRDGALAYAPFDLARTADGVVLAGDVLASPVDEFNAPVGAALCERTTPQFPSADMPGTSGLPAYGSCARLDVVGPVIAAVLGLEVEVDATHPICQTTRTTLSALRIDDHVIGTMPGEVSVLIADLVRATSPVDAAHTIVVGYAQGHVGYLLRPEDWVLGGYESSITFWGPLEGEYLAERLVELMPLATTAEREDGAADGTTRVATATTTDDFPIDDPAPAAGTVPATVSPDVWVRSGTPATAQPAAQIPRVGGLATFVWNGDDPAVKTPVVTLQREVGKGAFEDVRRRSGRTVRDGDLLVTYTPLPLHREGPQTHTWAVEWQAVPWLGAEGMDALEDRARVPLGRYRFHVEGDGWSLASDPFEVVPGGLGAVASRAGTVLTLTATLGAPKGFRLLDLEAPSNRPVPLRQRTISVELLATDVVLFAGSAETSDTGVVTLDRAEVATATSVRITDEHGNTATTAL